MPVPEEKRNVVRVYMSAEMSAALNAACESRGINRSEFIRLAVALELGDESLSEMAPAHRPKGKWGSGVTDE